MGELWQFFEYQIHCTTRVCINVDRIGMGSIFLGFNLTVGKVSMAAHCSIFSAALAFGFKDNKQDIFSAIDRFGYGGGKTNLTDALRLARETLFTRYVCVIIYNSLFISLTLHNINFYHPKKGIVFGCIYFCFYVCQCSISRTT